MKIVTTTSEMKSLSLTYRKAGRTVALVPTMGALHAGHISLVALAKKQCSTVVMSIFVNPTQFGPHEDFAQYPRPFEEDCQKAEAGGCDIVFTPSKSEMYPEGSSTFIQVEGLSEQLCGASRPGHFRGVATVVLKFFNIVSPKAAVFGQKDAMQCIILKRMVTDLHCPVELVFAQTMREADGLAMSSRNTYLTSAERSAAPLLYKGLEKARELYGAGERNASRIRSAILGLYEKTASFSTEYVEIVDVERVQTLVKIDRPGLVAVAVRTRESQTRLIDNIILGGTL
jgi:pantoate--beta-alanine ligase